jgi:hypothetical protein
LPQISVCGRRVDMHVARRTGLFGKTIIGLAIAAWFGLLAGCAPIQGYPKDPEDTDATLTPLPRTSTATKKRRISIPGWIRGRRR